MCYSLCSDLGKGKDADLNPPHQDPVNPVIKNHPFKSII